MKRVIAMALTACAGQTFNSADTASAARLDQARAAIAPPLGATVYTLDQRRLRDQPGGENVSLDRSLLQLPGVSLGPNGLISVRGQ